MNLHKQQLYLLEQHSESLKIWSAIIRINTVGVILDYEIGAKQKVTQLFWILL